MYPEAYTQNIDTFCQLQKLYFELWYNLIVTMPLGQCKNNKHIQNLLLDISLNKSVGLHLENQSMPNSGYVPLNLAGDLTMLLI